MADAPTPFVARSEDLDALRAHWEAAQGGDARLVRVVAPFGGGRRALVSRFTADLRGEGVDVIPWRIGGTDAEHGTNWLMRSYGGLVAGIAPDVLLRGKVEMILNGQLAKQPKRVQGWYQGFVQTLKEAKPDEGGQIQLRISQDNPFLGLVEVAVGIARKVPVVVEVQNVQFVHSVLPSMFLETLLREAKAAEARVLVLVHDEPEGDARAAGHPAPLLDMWERLGDQAHAHTIAPWGEDEVRTYLASKGLEAHAAAAPHLARIASGRPAFVADVTELLQGEDRLGDDLSEVTLASLTPLDVDEDELDLPDEAPAEGQPKHAGPDDAQFVAYLAALLGQAFPGALVAEMGGFDRESIDDLVDAMDALFEEVQFSDALGTWIYRFSRGSFREGVIEGMAGEDGDRIGRNVAAFLERFLAPRGLSYLQRALFLFARHGAPNRARAARAAALGRDEANAWGMAYDALKYFDEVPWSDSLRRTIGTSLLDQLVQSGNPEVAERVHGELTAWAVEKDDRDLQAWLLFNGSKLDARRRDLFRARDRAQDAVKLYEALERRARVGEVLIHMASLEMQDGKPDAALERAQEALDKSTREVADEDSGETRRVAPPQVFAQVAILRGSILRQRDDAEKAIEQFRMANEIAGQAGLAGLAVDAGISLGEALLATQKLSDGLDVLRRIATAASQAQMGARERMACELLAQAEAMNGSPERALPVAQRALQISQQLRLNHLLPVDLHRVGFFLLAQNKAQDALPFFQQADQLLRDQADHPLRRDLHYHLGITLLQGGQAGEARKHLLTALPLIRQARDGRKLLSALDALARLEEQGGDTAAARKFLEEALELARQNGLKDARKAFKKRLDGLATA